MSRRKAWLPIDPEHVVVEYVRRGRSESAAAALRRIYDGAPFEQRQLLRERLARAIALFEEARERNDRLGIYRR